MTGFQVVDYFTFYWKRPAPSRHCDFSDCNKELSHYHCNFCQMTVCGFSKYKMEKHLMSKHRNQVTLDAHGEGCSCCRCCIQTGLNMEVDLTDDNDLGSGDAERNDERNKAVEDEAEILKKKRAASRPPLSRKLINIMIDFLMQEDRRPVPLDTPVWSRAWADVISMETEITLYMKRITLKQRFISWIRMLDLVTTEDGEPVLCIAGTNKIVPPKEEIPGIVRDAHRMTGVFKASSVQDEKKESQHAGRSQKRGKHNSVEKVVKLIKDKYAFGNREFGIRKLTIYREILRCPECYADGKLRIPGKDVVQEVELVDPDFGNEMNYISLKNAPVSFTKKGPSKSSVWFDQAGLASKGNVYNKLLGVVEEVGIEIGKTTQDDPSAKERLITKLCCAEKLVNDLKEKAAEVFAYRIPSSHFMNDFVNLQSEYLYTGNTALYLQDLNYLLNTYKGFRNNNFISSINNTLQKLAKVEGCTLRIVPSEDGLYLEGELDQSARDNVPDAQAEKESSESEGNAADEKEDISEPKQNEIELPGGTSSDQTEIPDLVIRNVDISKTIKGDQGLPNLVIRSFENQKEGDEIQITSKVKLENPIP